MKRAPVMTLFAPLPTVPGGFRCVTIDAPLHFGTRSAKGQGRSPSRHYNDHTAAEIMTLPVREIVARDAWLFLWWPDPHILMLPDMLDAFGFELSGKGFTWIKTLKSLARGSRLISTDEIESVLRMNNGFTTRKNSETVGSAAAAIRKSCPMPCVKSSSRLYVNIAASPTSFITVSNGSALALASICSVARAAKAGRSLEMNRTGSIRPPRFISPHWRLCHDRKR
jgi:hypothetical protein